MKGLDQRQYNLLLNSDNFAWRLVATKWRFLVMPLIFIYRLYIFLAHFSIVPVVVLFAIACGIVHAFTEIPSVLGRSSLR